MTLALSTWLLVAQAPAAPAPSARELKQMALDSRSGIKSGHVSLELREPRVGNPAAREYQNIIRKYDIYFDGKKRRSFVNWSHPKWVRSTRAAVTEFQYVFDWKPDYWVLVGSVRDLPIDATGQLFHPAFLGMFCVKTGLLHSIEVESKLPALYELGGKDEGTVARDAVEGEDTWRVEFRPRPKRTVRIWIAPRLGYQPVRVEASDVDTANKPFVTRVDSTYDRYPRGDVWFPRKVVLRSWRGDQLYDESIVDVVEAEFNQPIDPSFFSIESFGLPLGRKVLGPGSREMIWDGKRLVDSVHGVETTDSDSSPSSRFRSSNSPRRWWWTGAITSSLVAFLMLARVFRARKQ